MSIFNKIFKSDNTVKVAESNTVAQIPVEAPNTISLAKEEVHKICLSKKPLNGLVARVGLVLDYSGSMSRLYDNGTMQSVIEKILPLAMEFDDNSTMEVWIFENGYHRLPDINLSNYKEYVNRKIIRKYNMGGTNYAPVMKDVVKEYKKGKLPAYTLFITDGDNFDKEDTDKAIIEASKYPIFWQFVGLGGADFNYLQKLDDMSGRYVDNADFFKVNKASDITYNDLLNEFPNWLEYDKVKDMLR